MLQKYRIVINECGKDGWVPVHPLSDIICNGLNEVMTFLAEQVDFSYMEVKGYLNCDSNSVFCLECRDDAECRNEDGKRYLRIEVWKEK